MNKEEIQEIINETTDPKTKETLAKIFKQKKLDKLVKNVSVLYGVALGALILNGIIYLSLSFKWQMIFDGFTFMALLNTTLIGLFGVCNYQISARVVKKLLEKEDEL